MLLLGALLFLPAGTLYWREGWLLMGILFVPMFIAGLIMMKKAPSLLVSDTGLYGVVRHPMYMSTLILFLSMPLVLGSVISFVILLAYIPIIAKRIRNEEQVLEAGLDGYAEYKTHVRYKAIPYIW